MTSAAHIGGCKSSMFVSTSLDMYEPIGSSKVQRGDKPKFFESHPLNGAAETLAL